MPLPSITTTTPGQGGGAAGVDMKNGTAMSPIAAQPTLPTGGSDLRPSIARASRSHRPGLRISRRLWPRVHDDAVARRAVDEVERLRWRRGDGLDRGEARGAAHAVERGLVGRPPVADVAVELGEGEELGERPGGLPLDVRRDRLDHRELARQPAQPAQAGERLLEVVEHSEEERDVELSEGVEVDRHEVADHRLDAAVAGAVRGVEAGLAGQADRVPEVGPFVVLVGRDARGFARAVIRLLLVQ